MTDRKLENNDTSHLKKPSSSLSSSTTTTTSPPVLFEDGVDREKGSSITVDIVSVGSITKSDYQTAQQETFRTHPSVRNFYQITEWNDTDTKCHTDLTHSKLHNIIQYCKNPQHRKSISDTSWLLRKLVYHPKNHTGWMCAQKRPIDGLHIALQHYTHNKVPIPHYLLIIDDDTYINMPSLLQILQQNHTDTVSAMTTTSSSKIPIEIPNTPQLITGCRFNYPQREHFLFPFGGFGTILSHTVIRNLIEPIHCTTTTTTNTATTTTTTSGLLGFVQAACWRLQQNLMGELEYFHNGMSIGDLMYEYTKQLSFTEINSWKNGQGFCFHSDHALGYFFGYYHLAVPEEQFILALHNTSIYETLRMNYGYVNLAGPPGGCKHYKRRCSVNSTICHYIPPRQMHTLFRQGNDLKEQVAIRQ
jgi:hypothetical protein